MPPQGLEPQIFSFFLINTLTSGVDSCSSVWIFPSLCWFWRSFSRQSLTYCFKGFLQLLPPAQPDLPVHALPHLALESPQAGCLLLLLLLQLFLHPECRSLGEGEADFTRVLPHCSIRAACIPVFPFPSAQGTWQTGSTLSKLQVLFQNMWNNSLDNIYWVIMG